MGKILIVDDVQVNTEILGDMLASFGIETDIVTNGLACLKKIAGTKYDAILLDYRMPEMDGMEVIMKARQMENAKDIPIIILSADDSGDVVRGFIEKGANDFMKKPISPSDLKIVLAKHLPKEMISWNKNIGNTGRKKSALDEISGKMINNFVSGAESTLNELDIFSKIRDLDRYLIRIHSLITTAELINANELAEKAAEIENIVLEGDWNSVDKENAVLMEMYRKAVTQLLRQN